MSDEPELREEIEPSLGVALARKAWQTAGGRCTASLHTHRSTGALWLVLAEEDQDGGDWSAAAATDEVATVISGDTLIVAGVAAVATAALDLRFDDRDATLTPAGNGAWLAILHDVALPSILTVRERDERGAARHAIELTFEVGDWAEPRLRRALLRLRLALNLPGALGLPRRTTDYPRRSR